LTNISHNDSTTKAPDIIGGLRRGEMAADHFTIVANLVARDKKLSCRAKGLFLNMASHREGFKITEDFLASQCTDGVKAIRAILLELREAGYVYRSEDRERYPKGTVNAKGKDISGALGPYRWFVTDRPDEIAVILTQYAQEQHAANTAADECADQDYVPDGQVVMTSENDESPDSDDSPALPPATAASDDQAKHGQTAGHHLRPKPPVGSGSTKEDQPKKNTSLEEEAGGRDAAPQTPAYRKNADQVESVVTDHLELVGNPPHARAEQPGVREDDRGDETGFRMWGVAALLAEVDRQQVLIGQQTGRQAWATARRIRAIQAVLRSRDANTTHDELATASGAR
jgi:hypothetical protein